MIKEIHLYDFDQTLFKSPDSESGDPNVDVIWGNDIRSLSEPCVPNNPGANWWHLNVVQDAKNSIQRSDVYAIVVTARYGGSMLRERVKFLLKSQGLNFDKIFFKPVDGSDTGAYKCSAINKVYRFLGGKKFLTSVSVWEDDLKRLPIYKRYIESLGLEANIFAVKRHNNTCNPDKISSFLKGIPLYLNTSNSVKKKEYKELGLDVEGYYTKDLQEPNSDPLTVIRYKASQFDEGVLVEDTSLEVAGRDIGVNVKWLLNELPKLAGKKASFKVLLGVRVKNLIYVYEGVVEGELVAPTKEGYGFDAMFLPKGTHLTLAEDKPRKFNPRSIVVDKIKRNAKPDYVLESLTDWDGDFQG